MIIITHFIYLSCCKLEFRARARNLNPDARIAVKDVHYVNCNPEYIPSTTDGKCIPSTADDSTQMIHSFLLWEELEILILVNCKIKTKSLRNSRETKQWEW